MSTGPSVVLARGARHAEDLVLREIERLAGAGDAALDGPTRVVVPSNSLQRHLSARLAGRGPILGIRVQTLRSLAAEILGRAGEPLPLDRALLEVLAAREAARRPALAEVLAGLDGSTGALAGSVCDLLDAGFGPAHLEAVIDRLAELGPSGSAELARARAVAEVAAAAAAALDDLGAGGSALLWRRAAHHLALAGEAALPSRGVLIHGFANATGTAADLLEALVVRLGARAVVDVPADPVDATRRDRGEGFTTRLRERLSGSRGETSAGSGLPESPQIRMLLAKGVDGEVRTVAAEILALLDRGVAPERIAVVARQLAGLEPTLSAHFQRMGIPFTAQGGRGLAGSARRKVSAFVRLLERGRDTPLDTWLVLRDGPGPTEDLRVGLRVAGVATLGELADLCPGELLGSEADLRLPVRTGLEAIQTEGQARLEAHRRRVPRWHLERAVEDARELCRVLDAHPTGPASRHLAAVRDLAQRFRGPNGREDVLGATLDALAQTIPAGVDLEWPEVLLLLRRALPAAGWEVLGGIGGGVQTLGVTQARGLTFDHLFLLGLNRDVFPRVVTEDPLLPDRVRMALLPVLPDLPVKALGHEEERYLFAHLLGAAREVTLSWQAADDDGRAMPPSPLVQRLLLAAVGEAGPGRGGGGSTLAPRPATLLEHAVGTGLGGDRDLWEEVMDLAVAEVNGPPGLAGVRRRVLDEVDPDLRTPRGRQVGSMAGPYLGALGAVAPYGELEGHLFVTTLEATARCPWQALLRRLLKLEHAPDPSQELGSLPPSLVGNVVHAVLAEIVAGSDVGVTWDRALEGTPHSVSWPALSALESMAREAAFRIGRLVGIGSPGLLAALARRALPALEVARRLDWEGAGPQVLGAEVAGRVAVGDLERRTRWVGFTCDRVDRRPGGEVVGTDYKTGRPHGEARQDKTRRAHLLQAIRRGEALQASAYACATGGAGWGRYLYLHPQVPEQAREAAVRASDEEAGEAFRETVAVLIGMWDGGLFPPRLAEPSTGKTPEACSRCELVEACSQHDSGARHRLARWAAGATASRALGAWWRLPLGRVTEGEGP